MKTKQEILDFLEKNNCNQKLINDIKKDFGYQWIALSYKENGAKFTELTLQQDKAKDGNNAFWIALSYKENGVEATELALQQEKAESGWDVYRIARSYKKNGTKFTELALQQEKAESGEDVYKSGEDA